LPASASQMASATEALKPAPSVFSIGPSIIG